MNEVDELKKHIDELRHMLKIVHRALKYPMLYDKKVINEYVKETLQKTDVRRS